MANPLLFLTGAKSALVSLPVEEVVTRAAFDFSTLSSCVTVQLPLSFVFT